MRKSKRILALSTLLLLPVMLLAGCQGVVPPSAGGEPAAPETKPRLVVSVWGGSYADQFDQHVAQPFAEQFNAEVILDTGGSSERLSKLIATKGNPEVDLFYITDYQAAIAKQEGLLLPVRSENVPNTDKLYEPFKDPLGDGTCPAFTVLGVGMAYHKEEVSPPFSWMDLWQVDMKDRIAVPDISISTGPPLLVEIASLNGGGLQNVDPGFEKFKELKENIHLIYSRTQEVVTAINQGDIVLSPGLNIFIQESPDQPIGFAWPTEGGLGIVNLACVVQGTGNRKLAEQFIDFHLAVEQQRAMAVNQSESPTNRNVELSGDAAAGLLYGEEAIDSLNFFDPNVLARNREAWIERWNQEIVAR